MMKNSKLSKLLVAGVSVAVLASAVAPMAFAEDSDVAVTGTVTGTETTVNVYVQVNKDKVNAGYTSTDYTLNNDYGTWNDANSTAGVNWGTNLTYYKYVTYSTTEYEPKADGTADLTKPVFDKTIGKDIVKATSRNCPVDNWSVMTKATSAGEIVLNKLDVSEMSLDSLYRNYRIKPEVDPAWSGIYLVYDLKTAETADFSIVDVSTKVTDETTAGLINGDDDLFNTVLYSATTHTKGDAVTNKKVLLTDKITLPTYKADSENGYSFDTNKVKVEVAFFGSPALEKEVLNLEVANGGFIDLASLGLEKYFDTNGSYKGYTPTVTVTVTPTFEKVNAVKVKIENKAYEIVTEDDKDVAKQIKTYTVKGVDNIAVIDLNDYIGAGKVVNYGETKVLPSVKINGQPSTDKNVYTFDHWEVASTDKNLLADGKTVAAGLLIADNTIVPETFLATEDPTETELTIIPVFTTEKAAQEERTFGAFKTPNDKVKVYDKNNVIIKTNATYDEFLQYVTNDETAKFEGGAFFNQVDEVWEYYASEKALVGGWIIDETFTDIADDIYYVEGKQDTEAFGLKDYSGAEGWKFLVANGEVNRDFNGLWKDPQDGLWYYLTKGCTSKPAEGVFENTNGWFYSFKDGKVDTEANGLVLYGSTWYNMVKGTCNTTIEVEVVEASGAFFYVKNGVVDTTFSGEYEGHTFVNGWAAK